MLFMPNKCCNEHFQWVFKEFIDVPYCTILFSISEMHCNLFLRKIVFIHIFFTMPMRIKSCKSYIHLQNPLIISINKQHWRAIRLKRMESHYTATCTFWNSGQLLWFLFATRQCQTYMTGSTINESLKTLS